MKIKPEHYQTIKAHVKSVLDKNTCEANKQIIGFWIARRKEKGCTAHPSVIVLSSSPFIDGMLSWIIENIYPYANDCNLRTVYKKIWSELELDKYL